MGTIDGKKFMISSGSDIGTRVVQIVPLGNGENKMSSLKVYC